MRTHLSGRGTSYLQMINSDQLFHRQKMNTHHSRGSDGRGAW